MTGFRSGILLFSLTLLLHRASLTQVRTCNNIASPFNVDIEGCDIPPCELPQRSNAVMILIFPVPKYYNSISPNVLATVSGVETTYPLNSNGCVNLLNGYCPIVQGEILEYKFLMPISVLFPRVDVDIEFKLLGNNNSSEPITCFKVAARVVAPR